MMEHWVQPDHVDRLRVHYNRRVERFAKPGDTYLHCSPQGAESFRRLRHETLTAERLMAVVFRDQGVISDEVLHRIEQELDVEAIRPGIGDLRPNGSFSQSRGRGDLRSLACLTKGPSVPMTPPISFVGDSQDHVRGPDNTPVMLIAYCDFECPYSGEIYPVIHALVQQARDRVRYIFWHFPLLHKHPHAQQALEAAEGPARKGGFARCTICSLLIRPPRGDRSVRLCVGVKIGARRI